MRFLLSIAILGSGCASQIRTELVATGHGLVTARTASGTTATGTTAAAPGSGGVALPRGTYEVALRFGVPRAQLVDWHIACPGVDVGGTAGESFDDYRERRLKVLAAERETRRRRAEAAASAAPPAPPAPTIATIETPAVGGEIATPIGTVRAGAGTVVRTEVRTPPPPSATPVAEVIAPDPDAPLVLPPGDDGHGIVPATTRFDTTAAGACIVTAVADDPNVTAFYSFTRIRNLGVEAAERKQAVYVHAVGVRGRLSNRLVAYGADRDARLRRREAEARNRREAEARARAELARREDARRQAGEAARLRAEKQRAEAERAHAEREHVANDETHETAHETHETHETHDVMTARERCEAARARRTIHRDEHHVASGHASSEHVVDESSDARVDIHHDHTVSERVDAEHEVTETVDECGNLDRTDRERIDIERIEHERLVIERALRYRRTLVGWLVGHGGDLALYERHRIERLRIERERIERIRIERERIEHERLERERVARERERLERERETRLERERQARLERERLERERLERERTERALRVRRTVIGELIAAGAHLRPPRPAPLPEHPGDAPFDGAIWTEGRWSWLSLQGRWEWTAGGWSDPDRFGDAGSSGPAVVSRAVTVEEAPPPTVTTTTTTTVVTSPPPPVVVAPRPSVVIEVGPVVRDHRVPRPRGRPAPVVRDHHRSARPPRARPAPVVRDHRSARSPRTRPAPVVRDHRSPRRHRRRD